MPIKPLVNLVVFFLVGCAGALPATKGSTSAAAKAIEKDAPASEQISPALAAGALLERGIFLLETESYVESAIAFELAIRTDRLNEVGRALAYWHIFLCKQRLRDYDGSAESLSSFIIIAQDLVAERGDNVGALNNDDFLLRFGVEDKIAHARAILSATWANRSFPFGRTPQRPVPVHTTTELDYFLELVEPCDSVVRRETSRREIAELSGRPLQKVTLRCGAEEPAVTYFFDLAP